MADAKIILTAIDQTKAAFLSAQRNLQSLSDAASALPARFGSIGLAISAAFGAITLKGAIDTLDRLDDLAEKTGIAADSLAALRYAGEVVGTPLESIAAGVKKLSVNMAAAAGGNKEATASFRALGISVENADGSLRNQDDVLGDLADTFSRWSDSAEKSAWAQRIFGKSGEEMIPLLNLGADGIRKMRQEAEQLGAVYGGQLAKEAAAFNDNLKRISLNVEAAKVSIVGGFLPSLVELTDKFIAARKAGLGFFESIGLATGTSAIKNWSAALSDPNMDPRRRKALLEMQRIEALQGSENNQSDAEARRLGLKTLAKTGAPKLPDTKAPDHYADNFINQLITQLANLSGQMSKAEEVTRQLNTATEKFTKAQREQALALAREIDDWQQRLKVAQAWSSYLTQQSQAQEQADEAFQKNTRSLSDLSREYEFQATLLGKTAEQQERMNYERQVALQLQEMLVELAREADKGAISEEQRMEREIALRNLANKALEDQARFMQERESRLRDPVAGATEALVEYERTASRVGESMKNAFTNAFRGMEDALTDFVMSGKLDFKSLADSIIRDMIRIEVQQRVTRPLGQMMKDSSIVGGLKSLFSFDGGGFTGLGSRSGGLDGRGGFLALMHPNETVIDHTKPSSGGGTVVVNQTNNIDARSDQASIMAAIRAGGEAIKADILRSRSRGGAFA